MTAAVLYGPGDVRIQRRDPLEAGAGEVLVRIKACGVCGTDAALYRGEYPGDVPVVIGHEFSGEVEAVGEGVSLRPGQRVTVDPNVVCHACEYCRGGSEHLCENVSSMGVNRDGADAEYCVAPVSNVYLVPDNVSFEAAAFCEPLACAIHALDLAQVRLGDTVLILGAGGMGNLLTQCARDAGAARVVVSEPIALRRDRVMENGATHVLDPLKQDVEKEIRSMTHVGADVVIEAAGNLEAQTSCTSLVRKGGTVVWFGVSPQDRLVQVSPFDINENELRILGSYNNPFATDRAVRMLAERRVQVDNLISHRIELRDYLQVFSMFGGKDTLKLMVTVGD